MSLEEGPYYIQKIVPSVHQPQWVGLLSTKKTEVLNEKANNSGLYAAGELTGLSGKNRLRRKCDYGYYHIRTYCR